MDQQKRTPGKSITTSVPTFAIRFHAEDEELEEIYPSAEETDEEAEKQEDESSSSAGGTQAAQTTVTTSASATTSTIHSRDPSPMKEYFKRFWKKGKIAKTVEEKLGEIKTDRKSSSSVFSGSSNIRAGRLVAGGSKDDSSINSDSEDISESSSKGLESRSSSRKDENSPKKSTFPKSTSLDAPSTSGKQDNGGQTSMPTTPSKSKKQNDKNKEPENTAIEQSSSLIEEEEEEVESGVEVDEQMTFSTITEPEEENIPTIDYRRPFPVTTPPLKPKQKRKKSVLYRIRWWGGKLLPFIAILIYYIFPLPPFLSGLIGGIVITLGISAVYSKVKPVISPQLTVSEEFILKHDNEFALPDYTRMPILEIPPVKEYHHINKYRGWMNEYRHDYDPETYSLNDTDSVYVRLEGATLRISHTKLRIPKRAMWNERPHKLKFYHQRIYSIEDCKLKLLPEGLTRRRIWSKKYPICIVLSKMSKLGFRDFPDIDKQKDKLAESVNEELDEHMGHDGGTSHNFEGEELEMNEENLQQTSEEKERSYSPDISVMEESDDDTFCHIDKPEAMETCLYLFARTDREKEDWYRRFATAIRHNRSEVEQEELVCSFPEVVLDTIAKDDTMTDTVSFHTNTSGGQSVIPSRTVRLYTFAMNEYMSVKSFETRDYEYLRFMSKFQQVQKYKMNCMLEKRMCAALKHTHSRYAIPMTAAQSKKQEAMEKEIEAGMDKEIDADVMWVNALVGRVLFDILKNPEWTEKIKERLQRKMSTIKLPYFIEDLIITELDLGHNMPMAHRASRPKLDERGLWIDLDITYDGTACFTLVTKLNLMKIKQMGEMTAATSEKEDASQGEKSKSPMYDSELDDTAESSDDDSNVEGEGKSSSGEEQNSV
ncbi:hypothetical protein L9F63_007977, partial [Diploptera punctata]